MQKNNIQVYTISINIEFLSFNSLSILFTLRKIFTCLFLVYKVNTINLQQNIYLPPVRIKTYVHYLSLSKNYIMIYSLYIFDKFLLKCKQETNLLSWYFNKKLTFFIKTVRFCFTSLFISAHINALFYTTYNS